MLTAAIGGIIKADGFRSGTPTLSLNKSCLLYVLIKSARSILLSGCLESEVEKAGTFSVVMLLKSEERTNAA
jgi:hypothetical protein